MHCTSCGEENRPGAKFCVECGTPMLRPCGSCGHTLQPTAKFCDECGAPVATSPSGTTVDAAGVDGAVRRIVTIMFADLVGSTAFGESVDAETARREMAGYHALAREVVEDHTGAVVKFIGDGVMAGFGLTDVAEDDADRAVRAGIALQRAFESIVTRIRDRHGAEVSLRVGINTGEVVVAEGDADIVGDAINTAARIEAQCTPGRVLVGEQTWRLTRSGVDYEVLGEVEVKGKSDPIATFQVVAAVEDEEVATPFVGREDELTTLTAHLEDTIASASPQLVTVIGSPGVGKTRLAAELAGRASEVTSFDIRVDRAGAATFEPIADLLRTVSGLPSGLDAEATVAHLAEFVGTDDADRLVPILASFLGAGPARSTEESLWGSRRLVELIVTDQPAVIVVDDIQWAEPLFHDLLEHLVEWVEGAAFVVALARPEIREIRPTFAEVGRRISEVVRLDGLDPSTTAELASGILGGKALPPGLADRLPASTDGNPLFVRELVRMLVDDGTITEGDDRWVLAIDIDAIDVPPTIISLLASRVERMASEERRVVEAASVVGSEFARGAVHALLPDLGVAQLDRLLEQLRRQELIDATGTYWGDEPVWRFHHVLIRDAAYRRLLKERRAELHRQVGDWTEAAAVDIRGEHEIAIGYHFEQAFGYLDELGPLDETGRSLGTRAANLFATAATRSVERDDLAAAGPLAGRALAVLPADDPRRGDLLLLACESFFGAGRVNEGTPWFDELRAHPGDERIDAWTRAYEGEYVVLTDPGRLDEIEPVVDAAADQLAELGDDSGVAKARLVRAQIMARTGRVAECEGELDAALAAARAADDRRRITAVLGAAPLAALWGPSPVARAGGRCLDIIRLLRITSASPMVEATSIRCQAVLEGMRGRFDEARNLIDRSRAIVDELGLRRGILECRLFAGYIELLAGNPAVAEAHLRVAHAGLASLGVRSETGQAAGLLSQALFELGRIDEASDLAEESAHLAGRNLQAAITAHTAQARVAMAEGRHDDALQLAEEGVGIAAGTDLTMDHAAATAELSRVHGARGDGAAAAKVGQQASALLASKGAVVSERPALGSELERAEGSESGTLENTSTVLLRQQLVLVREGRFDEWRQRVRDDFWMADARQFGIGTWTRADLEAAFRSRLDHSPSYTLTIHAVRADHLCLVTLRMTLDDFVNEQLVVIEVDPTGALASGATFDAGAFADAERELDRRHTSPLPTHLTPPGNRAVANVLAAIPLLEQGDFDAWRATLRPDLELVDTRQLSHPVWSLDDLEAAFRSRLDGEPRYSLESLATRGRHIALVAFEMTLSNEFTNRQLMVHECDEDALGRRSAVFDADQHVEAVRQLDEWYRDSLGDDERLAFDYLLNSTAYQQSGDREAFLAQLAPDFLAVDRRVGGFGTVDRDGWADRNVSFVDVTDGFTNEVLGVHAINENGMLAEIRLRDANTNEWRFFAVGTARHGVGQRTEIFDATDFAEARQRFDELTGDGAPSRATLRPLDNQALRLIQASLDYLSGGPAPETSQLSENFVNDDRRSVGVMNLDRDGMAALMSAARDEGASVSLTPIATRGDRMAAARYDIRWTTDDIAEATVLAARLDEVGRCERMTFFDSGEIDAAIGLVDEWYAESLAPDERQAFELQLKAVKAQRGADRDALDRLVPDHFVAVDRRRGGTLHLDRDMWIDANANFATISEGFTNRLVSIRLTARAALLEMQFTDAADHEWSFLAVSLLEGGVPQRIELFDPSDWVAAHAQFEEWRVGEGNAASESYLRHLRAIFELQDAELAMAELADDLHAEDRRPLVAVAVGKDQFVANWQRPLTAERPVWWEVNEVHAFGDRVAVIEWETGPGLEFATVAAVGDHGLAINHTTYGRDQFDEACAHARELAGTVHEHHNRAVDIVSEFWRLILAEGDVESAIALNDPGCETIDRRRMMGDQHLEAESAAYYAELIQPIGTSVPHEVVPLAIAGDDRALIHLSATDPEGSWAYEVVQLVELSLSGLIRRVVTHSSEDEAQARAEFAAPATARPAERDAPERPQAAIWLDEIGAIYNANEIERWAARLAEEWVSHDERPMNLSVVDKATTVAWNAQLFAGADELAGPINMAVEIIDATDRHTIFRAEFVDTDLGVHAWATPMVIVQRWTDDGLYAEEWLYAPEQLAEAEATYAALTRAPEAEDELHNEATEWARRTHPELADAEVLSIADTGAALLRSDGFHVVWIEPDGDGAVSSHGSEELHDAQLAYRRVIDARLPERERATAEFMNAITEVLNDPDRFVELLAPDFAAIDHQPTGLLQVNREQSHAYRRAVLETRPPVGIARRVLGRHGDTILAERLETDGEYEWRYLTLLQREGDLLARMELWDPDDEHAALARFGEVVLSMDSGTVDPDTNDAFVAWFAANPAPSDAQIDLLRTAAQLGAAHGDAAAASALVSPDFEFVDRRTVVAKPSADGKPGMAALSDEQASMALPVYRTRRVLGVSDHALLLEQFRVAQGYEWQMLTLLTVHDGQVTRLEGFDVDDEAAALARFDAMSTSASRPESLSNAASAWARRHEPRLADADVIAVAHDLGALLHDHQEQQYIFVHLDDAGLGRIEMLETQDLGEAVYRYQEMGLPLLPEWERNGLMILAIHGANAGDPEKATELLTDDFAYVDHSQLLGGYAVGPEAARPLAESIADLGGALTVTRRFVATMPGLYLMETLAFSGGYEWHGLGLSQLRDGKVRRHEVWGMEDEDAALARFEELAREMEPHNAASDLFIQQHVEIFDNQDLEAGLAFVHPQATGEDRRSVITEVTITREQFAENYRQALDAEEPIPWTSRVLHTIGDRIAVVRLLVGSHYDWVTAIEIDGDGLGIRAVNFDYAQLDDALAEAARWHEEQT